MTILFILFSGVRALDTEALLNSLFPLCCILADVSTDSASYFFLASIELVSFGMVLIVLLFKTSLQNEQPTFVAFPFSVVAV